VSHTESATAPKLPTNRPTFRYDGGALGNFSAADVEDILLESFNGKGGWADWCDLKLSKHPNPKTDPTNVVILYDLGGGGILADQELPFGPPPYRMRINSRVLWKELMLLKTLRHENGHFISLSHFPSGGPKELMEPSLSEIVDVQPTEGMFAAKLYGEPKATAPGTPTGKITTKVQVIIDGIAWEAAGPMRKVSAPAALHVRAT
jgi:hypothetical protein